MLRNYRIVKTSELRLGDVVNCHGMRCLIDREIKVSTAHAGGDTLWTSALVLNRDEVPGSDVPYGFTIDWGQDGRKASNDDRWTIQGNDLARWAVELDHANIPVG